MSMKVMNKKKLIVSMIISATAVIISGWGFKRVELLTEGRLIDLEKAIEMAPFGSDEDVTEPEQDEEVIEDTKEDPEGQAETVTSKIIRVRIRGKEIFIDGEKCEAEDVAGALEKKCTSLDKVRLLDDYAEAHVYRKVDKIIEGSGKAIGFEYEAE